MLISVRCLMAAAIAVSALSAPAFAGDQTNGRAPGNAESLRSVGAVFPSRNIKTVAAVTADLTQSSRGTPTAGEATELFTLVGHTRSGKIVRRLPSDQIIRAVTETRP